MSDVLVLCYHAVSEHWTARLSITPELLERQLSELVERGYRGATFHQAVTAPPATRTLAVTFDDAYRSVFELAFPILSRLGLPATVFVPTALIGSEGPMSWPGIDEWLGGPYEHELVGMSWSELEQLVSSGWEAGSHTRSHPRLTTVAQERLEFELRGSREDCEQRLGGPCRSVAYPYGDVDDRVVEAARHAGYEAGAGLPGRVERARPLCWPREGVYWYDQMKKFRRKTSPFLRKLRGTPAWPAAEAVRRRLRGR